VEYVKKPATTRFKEDAPQPVLAGVVLG